MVSVDDIIISRGTIFEISKKIKSRGSLKIFACVTHALLTDKFLAGIENSSLDELIITDTIPMKKSHRHPKIKTLSVAQLLSDAISSIYNGDPLSKLFCGVHWINNL